MRVGVKERRMKERGGWCRRVGGSVKTGTASSSKVLGGGAAAAYTRQQARIFLARGFDERNHLLAHVCRLIVLKLKDFLFACVVRCVHRRSWH